jgi:dTDP-4-dehydrorhamnose reductase
MALTEQATPHGVTLIAVGRPEFDLADAERGLQVIEDARPDAIVSAAGYTAVDAAERDALTARLINQDGPAAVARLAARLSIPLLHLSTDYVYDGLKLAPYIETDATNPLGVYGATKLAGEQAVAAITADHVILRTAWVYSPFGNNFLKTMLRIGAERPELHVVDDQIGNPTSALDLADTVLRMTRNLCERKSDTSLRGIFHVTGSGEASWADFASEIFAISSKHGGPRASVTRITTSDYPTPARRPANSRLNCEKLGQTHGIIMPAWQSSVRATVSRLLRSTS